MDTKAYASMAQFCVEQHEKFDARAWKRRGSADRKLVALTARYLSMTSWFGHEDQLERIAVEIDAAVADPSRFNRELGAIGFDLAQFSMSVRGRIAARRLCPASP